MNWLHQTNSWHWLLMAMVLSSAIAAYLCLQVWDRVSKEYGPQLQGMQAHADALKLLQEEDALLVEHQVGEIEKRIQVYEAAVRDQVGQPVPSGEQAVPALGNEINRALLKSQLRVIEQEQLHSSDPPVPAPDAPRATVQADAAADALPYTTREIRYVTEGEYRHMFMFLIRQSHEKPSYHIKDIRIFPSPAETGMRMEFTVQIHFT